MFVCFLWRQVKTDESPMNSCWLFRTLTSEMWKKKFTSKSENSPLNLKNLLNVLLLLVRVTEKASEISNTTFKIIDANEMNTKRF